MLCRNHPGIRPTPKAERPSCRHLIRCDVNLPSISANSSGGRAALTQLREGVPYYLYAANRSEVAGFIYLGDDSRSQPTSFQAPPSVGDPAPNITLRAVEGNAQKQLSDYKGKWVYLDFWATWCGLCRPALEKIKAESPTLKERYKDSLAVVTVSIDDTPDPVKPYLEKLGLWGQCEHYWAAGTAQQAAPFVFGACPLH